MPAELAQKTFLLTCVKRGQISKTEAAKKLGVSRKTIYKWLEKEELSNNFNLLPKKLSKTELHKSKIIEAAIKYPDFGAKRLSNILKESNISISERSIWKFLRECNLSNYDWAKGGIKTSRCYDWQIFRRFFLSLARKLL